MRVVVNVLVISGASLTYAQNSPTPTASEPTNNAAFLNGDRVLTDGFEGYNLVAVLQNYALRHYRLQILGQAHQSRDSVERAFYFEIARICQGKKTKFESTDSTEIRHGTGGASWTLHRRVGLFECEK
jgi:hypothetical protein